MLQYPDFFFRILRHSDIKASEKVNHVFDASISGFPEIGVPLYCNKKHEEKLENKWSGHQILFGVVLGVLIDANREIHL